MERDGVDFWWLDWQQWKESKYTPGLSNTFCRIQLRKVGYLKRDGG